MRWFTSRRGLAFFGALLVLALFLARPGVNGLRLRLVNSLSNAIGRRVEISSVSLRLLPRPGFDLENFIVHDDPAFSAEPVLRADEVTASLRLLSLLRGRLEVSRLSLTEPSLNLVRNAEGHWNLESLVQRTAQAAVAPTNKGRAEKRPEFPYIEVVHGRINFKYGVEKKQFALSEADCALFQDSENTWGIRLKAIPIRTDTKLSDIGVLKVTGSWQRAASLHETPLRFGLTWEKAQLGQASKLIYGSDKGWRGTASISSEIVGMPSDLAIAGNISVDDFRRYDVLTESPLRLRAQCGSQYSSSTHTFDKIICDSPVGDGALALRGSIDVSEYAPVYQLTISAADVPMQALLDLARYAREEFPADLIATGTLDGTAKMKSRQTDAGVVRIWEGNGSTSEFRLRSKLAQTDVSLDRIHFAIVPSGASGKNPRKRVHPPPDSGFLETRLELSPFSARIGGETTATLYGWISRSGYNFSLEGSAQIQDILRAGRAMGVPSPQFPAQGKTIFNLEMADEWSGFKPQRVTGSAELRSIRAQIRGINAPIEIASAEIYLMLDEINVRNMTATVAGSTLQGSLTLPRPCVMDGTCVIEFDLQADEIGTDSLNKLLNPPASDNPWYSFVSGQAQKPFLRTLRANGHLTADLLRIRKLSSTKVSADVDLREGKLQLSNLRGTVLGGLHLGEWTADFAAKPPIYSGSGSFLAVSLSQLAGAMQDEWISGTATATYHATASGVDATTLLASLTGILHVEARNGFIYRLALANFPAPLRLQHFAGDLILRHRELDFEKARLETPSGAYQLNGTASFARVLNLTLSRSGSRGFNVTGNLHSPVVTSMPIVETRAALKP